ncbi:MAG: hypothetical protein A2252_12480 [Elusimicrobia bacterium RIFOXYA2_FULL_39_19]|nr:MAG: hypothetical protein A2252_12480 [Elusimicrobia bacterium RIFOXYA2_FULL_39_19]
MKNLEKLIIEIRRHVHQHPELGHKEFKTTAYIASILKTHNIAFKTLKPTGVLAWLPGKTPNKKPSKCIAIRADIDALPVTEKTNKPYSSKHLGIMHACGHDNHLAMVLGTALNLAGRRKDLEEKNCCIKFIFQPNEESAGGAIKVVQQGALINPKVDAIFGIHVSPGLESGQIGFKYGEMMAALITFEIEIYGGGGHTAYPHTGKDTILTASEIVIALKSYVSKHINPAEPAVISIGTIKGGTRYNVFADSIKMTGTFRTFSNNLIKQTPKIFNEIITSKTREFGLKHKFSYEINGHPVINTDSLVDSAVKSSRKVLGKEKVIILKKPSMGGEDFSEYLRTTPGCFMYLGASIKGVAKPWHHPEFDIDEKILIKGTNILSQIVLDTI